ncbi:MAG: Hsp20/alpha crystallin family protein [Firmicutes bacterium]|nr:Hsp20/alpha crystallin family protein [Bacillota bacterium]
MQYNNEFIQKALEMQKKAQELTNNNDWQQNFMESMMNAFQGWGNAQSKSTNENLKSLSNLWSSGMPALSDNRNLNFNINESEYEISLNAPLPGIRKPEDIAVKVQGDTVVISGRSDYLGNGSGQVSDFNRVIKLPTYVDSEGATAVYQQGYLNIRLPKKKNHTYNLRVNFR